MKSVLFVLFVLTTTPGSLSQTTPGNGLVLPKTDCGRRALKCWSDQMVNIGNADSTLDFATSCQLYKVYVDCYNALVKDATCAKETEVTSINLEISQDRLGLCTIDGQVTPCAVDLQTCIQDALALKNDYFKKNASAACPVFDKFMICAETAKSRQECSISSKILEILNQMETSLYTDDMLMGCGGQCGQQIGLCIGNLTEEIINANFMSLDWKQFCRDAFTAVDCIFHLSSNANCTGNDLVKSMTDSQHRVFGDYCAGNGKPAPCIQRLRRCQQLWNSSVSGTPTTDQYCQAASAYLDCTTKSACSPDLNDMLTDLRQGIDSQETKLHCPTEGTCLDRLIACTIWQQKLNRTDPGTTSVYCSLAKDGDACFRYVRKDAICKAENITISPYELSLPAILQKCGGQPPLSVHLLLIVIAFVVSATGLL